jgi:hypothetical protein
MKPVAMAGAAVLTLVLAVTVWPTRWKTETGAISGREITLRTDRLSGKVEYLTPQGWRPVTEAAQAGDRKPCSPEQLAKAEENPYILEFCKP